MTRTSVVKVYARTPSSEDYDENLFSGQNIGNHLKQGANYRGPLLPLYNAVNDKPESNGPPSMPSDESTQLKNWNHREVQINVINEKNAESLMSKGVNIDETFDPTSLCVDSFPLIYSDGSFAHFAIRNTRYKLLS